MICIEKVTVNFKKLTLESYTFFSSPYSFKGDFQMTSEKGSTQKTFSKDWKRSCDENWKKLRFISLGEEKSQLQLPWRLHVGA